MLWYIFRTGSQVSLSYVNSWMLGGSNWYSAWDIPLNHTWLHVTPVLFAHPWELGTLQRSEDVASGHEYFVASSQ